MLFDKMLIEAVEEQLGSGTKILRTYNAAENGELRVIAKIPGIEYEQRYRVRDMGGYFHLVYMP